MVDPLAALEFKNSVIVHLLDKLNGYSGIVWELGKQEYDQDYWSYQLIPEDEKSHRVGYAVTISLHGNELVIAFIGNLRFTWSNVARMYDINDPKSIEEIYAFLEEIGGSHGIRRPHVYKSQR